MCALQALAAAFMSADLGSDQKLDFGEFCACVPPHERKEHREDEMREVFDMADHDGSAAAA